MLIAAPSLLSTLLMNSGALMILGANARYISVMTLKTKSPARVVGLFALCPAMTFD